MAGWLLGFEANNRAPPRPARAGRHGDAHGLWEELQPLLESVGTDWTIFWRLLARCAREPAAGYGEGGYDSGGESGPSASMHC